MRKAIVRIYLCLVSVAVAYSLFVGLTGLGIPCYYLSVHGHACPGCGLSRMLFSLMKLQFGRAFWYNPVGFVAFWSWNTVAALCWWGKVPFVKKPLFAYSLLSLTMVAFLIQGFLRNYYEYLH